MKISSIEICNFGRFNGSNRFPIVTDESKNIVLIKANNDRGKTTFFNAVKFALYGPDSFEDVHNRQTKIAEYVNRQAMYEGPGEMFVEIKFEHEGNIFKIKRGISFDQVTLGSPAQINGNDEVVIWEGDQPIKLVSRENQNRWISHILPLDASQFFFFDGEEIKKYIEKQSNQRIKSAIEIVLGVKELLNGFEDFEENILKDFRREAGRQWKTKNKNKEDKEELEDLENVIEQKKIDRQIWNDEIKSCELMVKNYDKELKKYSAIVGFVNNREKAASEINIAEKRKEELFNLQTEMRGYSGLFLLYPLLEIIHKLKEDPPSFKIWESDTIKRLLDEKPENCICDRPLNQEILDSLSKKIIEAPQSRINLLRKNASDMLIHHNPQMKKDQFFDIVTDFSKTLQDISLWKDTIKELDGKIGSSQEVGEQIKYLNEEQVKKYQELGSLKSKIENIDREIERDEKELKSKKEALTKSINDKDLQRAEDLVKFSEKIRDAISLMIEKIREKRIEDIEKYVSEVFMRLTNNPEMYTGLKLDENYEIKVIRNDGTILPTYKYSPSAGASQIIATSLIAGLNKYTTREAPIIIDTPLGRLDPIHRENLFKFYHMLGKQVIILYQPGELHDNDILKFQENVASKWEIKEKADNPACSTITKEMDYFD